MCEDHMQSVADSMQIGAYCTWEDTVSVLKTLCMLWIILSNFTWDCYTLKLLIAPGTGKQ